MTPTRLAELESLAAAATPGPWTARRPRVNYRIMAGDVFVMEAGYPGVRMEDDAAFIAAARTAIPELVAEVRRLQALLDAK